MSNIHTVYMQTHYRVVYAIHHSVLSKFGVLQKSENVTFQHILYNTVYKPVEKKNILVSCMLLIITSFE